MENRNSRQIRRLVSAVKDRPTELPVKELMDLSDSGVDELTVDLSHEPTMAYARPPRHAAFDDLTPREQEVARIVAAGYSNKQIAAALFISLPTVKDHIHSILTKTGFENRAQIAIAWLGGETP